VPPIKGVDKKGVYALRTIDDASAILQEAHKARERRDRRGWPRRLRDR
jgi:NAD(P)H-nitrite reductase large subunit